MKTLELIGTYCGDRIRFDNPSSSVVVGSIRLRPESQKIAEAMGVDCYDLLGVKGEADRDELQPDHTYRFLGSFTRYHNKRTGKEEKQFAFKTFVPHVPHDRDALINYLVLNGKGRGIGPAKARLLVDHFGTDEVLRVCRELPGEVSSLAGISIADAESLAHQLQSQHATETTTLEVSKLLASHGFRKALARRVIREWGNRAAERIIEDPYSLMQFGGVGFRLADKLYCDLGKDQFSIDRQALCLWHIVNSDTNGHTWFFARDVIQKLQATLGTSDKVDYRAAIVRAKEMAEIPGHYAGIATLRTDDAGKISEDGKLLWIAELKLAEAERQLAELVKSCLSESDEQHLGKYSEAEVEDRQASEYARCARCHRVLTADTVHVLDGKPFGPKCVEQIVDFETHEVVTLTAWCERNPIVKKTIQQYLAGYITVRGFNLWPEVETIDGISDHQREQLAKALRSRLGILCGSPGTGKTFCVAKLIHALLDSGLVGLNEIIVCAPTGKAAVRLNEVLGNAGLSLKARTIHSTLGIGEQTETGGFTFRHGPENPLPGKVLIVDEVSMVDTSLLRSLLAARECGCHVLLVGDVNQLPPVGAGAPLRDLLAAGIPSGELTEIKRNSGGIVEACAAIRDQKPWSYMAKSPASNLQLIQVSGASKKAETIAELVRRAKAVSETIYDWQVLVAVNKGSELSRKKLNLWLQDIANENERVNGTIFRVGDKVVCLKNGYYSTPLEVKQTEDIQVNASGQVFVANGDLGEVRSIEGGKMTVAVTAPMRVVTVPLGKSSDEENQDEESGSGCAWDLGYALSVHKSQGSEFRFVFIAVDDYPGARLVCDRAWIYTAISRGKNNVVLVGEEDVANRFCSVQKIGDRKTFLAECLA